MQLLYYTIISFFIFLILLKKWKIVTYLFIIFLPLGNIFQSHILLPGMSIINIVSVALILIALSSRNIKKSFHDIDRFQLLAIQFIVFYFLVFNNMYVIKYDVLVRDAHLLRIIMDVLKNFLIGSAYIIIILNARQLFQNKILIKGISMGVFIVVISMIFSYQLMLMGFLVNTDMETISAFERVNIRLSGFYDGDVNAAAAFLIVIFGYFLTVYEKKKDIVTFLLLVISFSGMLFTGSRGVILAFVVVCILFFFNNGIKFSLKSFPGLIVLFSILYSIFLWQGDIIIERLISSESQHEMIVYQESFRFIRWKLLIEDMVLNPSFFLFGNLHTPPIGPQNQIIISPHNEFVRTLYFGGIFIFIYYIRLYIKIFKINNIIRKNSGLTIVYSAFGMVMTYMFLSNFVNQYFPIILILLGFYHLSNKDINKVENL